MLTRDQLEIIIAHIVPFGGPPCISPQFLFFKYIFWSFVTIGFNTFIWEQSCAHPGLGGVRDVAFSIISHEQTQSYCFQTLDIAFPNDPISDYL